MIDEKYLSKDDVRDIAKYARFELNAEEIDDMTQYLNGVVESLKPLTEYDLESVEPTYHPIGSLSNVMRKDVCKKSFTQEEALENAPAQKEGSFLIPSILGDWGDGS